MLTWKSHVDLTNGTLLSVEGLSLVRSRFYLSHALFNFEPPTQLTLLHSLFRTYLRGANEAVGLYLHRCLDRSPVMLLTDRICLAKHVDEELVFHRKGLLLGSFGCLPYPHVLRAIAFHESIVLWDRCWRPNPCSEFGHFLAISIPIHSWLLWGHFKVGL